MVSKKLLDFLYACLEHEKRELEKLESCGGLPADERIIGMHDQHMKDQRKAVALVDDIITQYVAACNES